MYKTNSQNGFTITELLVSMSLGLIILSMILEVVSANRNLYGHDIVRTRLNQDIRGALDIVAMDIREAGENLPNTFPSVLITDGGSLTDTLVLRRSLLDEVINICSPITAGTTNTTIIFGTTAGGAPAGCTYSSNTQNYSAWRTYRLADSDQNVDVYVYDVSSKLGEWIVYNGEADSGTQQSITKTAGTWQRSYAVGSAAAYIMEERKYAVNGGELQLFLNGANSNPLKVVFGLQDFQILALMQDSTTKTSFATSDDWTQLKGVRATLNATTTFRKKTISSNLSAEFFPRNVLSN